MKLKKIINTLLISTLVASTSFGYLGSGEPGDPVGLGITTLGATTYYAKTLGPAEAKIAYGIVALLSLALAFDGVNKQVVSNSEINSVKPFALAALAGVELSLSEQNKLQTIVDKLKDLNLVKELSMNNDEILLGIASY